jgi:hypothetical protein
MHVAELVKAFETNELRAYEAYVGKRVRVYGTVNSIDRKSSAIVVSFKGASSTYGSARCYFGEAQAARVATLSAHEEATVEGTVRGWEDGFDGAKVWILLDDCIVP